MEIAGDIFRTINEQIRQGKLVLPSLPDVTLKIHKTIHDPQASPEVIAKLLALDPALATKILKVANSVAYRMKLPVDNLQHAISCLGYKRIQALIINHALLHLFGQPQGQYGRWVSMIHNNSIRVAAQASAIASNYTNFNPDDAMLAGLIHNIGYLPLLQFYSQQKDSSQSQAAQWQTMQKLHALVGHLLLSKWLFPDSLNQVISEHNKIMRNPGPHADLTDVVIVARLSLPDTPAELQDDMPVLSPAFTRLGISSPEELRENQRVVDDYEKAMLLFSAIS